MTRNHPMSTDHLFQPISMLEHYKRTVDYLKAHRVLLLAGGSGKKQIATIDETIRQMQRIVDYSTIYPPDTPQPGPEPEPQQQPLVPPGSEEFMHDFIEELAK